MKKSEKKLKEKCSWVLRHVCQLYYRFSLVPYFGCRQYNVFSTLCKINLLQTCRNCCSKWKKKTTMIPKSCLLIPFAFAGNKPLFGKIYQCTTCNCCWRIFKIFPCGWLIQISSLELGELMFIAVFSSNSCQEKETLSSVYCSLSFYLFYFLVESRISVEMLANPSDEQINRQHSTYMRGR